MFGTLLDFGYERHFSDFQRILGRLMEDVDVPERSPRVSEEEYDQIAVRLKFVRALEQTSRSQRSQLCTLGITNYAAEQPALVWDMLVGARVINGRDVVGRDNIARVTYEELMFVRHEAGAEFFAAAAPVRARARADYVENRRCRVLNVGDFNLVVYPGKDFFMIPIDVPVFDAHAHDSRLMSRSMVDTSSKLEHANRDVFYKSYTYLMLKVCYDLERRVNPEPNPGSSFSALWEGATINENFYDSFVVCDFNEHHMGR